MKLFRRRKDKKRTDNESNQQHTDNAQQQNRPTMPPYMVLVSRATKLLQQGQAANAEPLFKQALDQMEAQDAQNAAPVTYSLAFMGLGQCLDQRGKFDEAISNLQRALTIMESQQANDLVNSALAQINLYLGNSLAAAGQLDEAQATFQRSFTIARQTQDKTQLMFAGAFHREGAAAFKRRNLPAAKHLYTEALSLYKKFGDQQKIGIIWHQLGRIGQLQALGAEAQDATKLLQAAEYSYQKAVDLFEQFNDASHLAGTYNELAGVVASLGRPDDAEQTYKKAIAIAESTEKRDFLSLIQNNLADFYLHQGRLEEAEKYAMLSLDIKKTLGPSTAPWTTYNILAQIAEAQGQDNEALHWRRQSQESFARSPDALQEVQRFQPLLMMIVGACVGNTELQAQLPQVLTRMENVDEGSRRFAQAVRRIQAGERDIDVLTAELDYTSAARVHAIHAVLTGKVNPHG
jgi:tetratricopeptide (TPR) repeat protein